VDLKELELLVRELKAVDMIRLACRVSGYPERIGMQSKIAKYMYIA
jgi:hypothetical protein